MSLALETAALLESKKNTPKELPATVGLDGFVDVILHVVKTRESAHSYERFTRMADWAERIHQADGLSANFEFVPQMVKLGGNGPIMANALMSMGFPMTYIGNLGHPEVHTVFSGFASRAKVYSIADPGVTDAVEFDNGKLMFGKHQPLRDVNWGNLLEKIGEQPLLDIFSQSKFLALVNWTMLTGMTEIFRQILADIAPKLEGRRTIFFDLADPAKRSREDIAEAIGLIADFEKSFDVILGLNMQEGRQIGEVLGLQPPPEEMEPVREHAAAIRAALGVGCVVIHPIPFAAAADASDSAVVPGPHTAKPKITTGGGDHFNAGFCLGRLLGGNLSQSLQTAVATSGFYVRNAKSPDIDDLTGFLRDLPA